jgi:chromosome partitioning protein
MSVPVLTFFNNKGGVGKTSLVYHLAWMLSKMGQRVLVCDLDPQANLTSAFLTEEKLEALWEDDGPHDNRTIFRCLAPLMEVGDLKAPALVTITEPLRLIPGDLGLSGFEDTLSAEWPAALGSSALFRPFRILTAFWQIMQKGAADMDATLILADVGPNLGAINRSALIATDHVIVPLGADLFSLQGLRNLGPTLKRWRSDWTKRRANWTSPSFDLPEGAMEPEGYVVQQHSVRLNRPVQAYDKWVNRMPREYAIQLLDDAVGPYPRSPAQDANCLATVKHYRSLVPMSQEARKPVFDLTAADGAIGSHAGAVASARKDFRELAALVCNRIGLS